MKYLDEVKVTVSKGKYEKSGVYKGAIGTIIFAAIRQNTYEVVFTRADGSDYAEIEIDVGDLAQVRNSNVTDEDILEDLPNHDPNWWCKVENGFIVNLKGERRIKLPMTMILN